MTEELVRQQRELDPDEKVFDVWARKNPRFDTIYEDDVIQYLCHYGKTYNKNTEATGKIFGPGYESYIIAFFIGLYSDRREKFSDGAELKGFGWPIENWTGTDRNGRSKYRRLIKYIFYALVAKTKVDWVAVDEGRMLVSEAVLLLTKAMEEYANYGYRVLKQHLDEDRNYFADNTSMLSLFKKLTEVNDSTNVFVDDKIEKL